MIDLDALEVALAGSPLVGWLADLRQRSIDWLEPDRHGDLQGWRDAVDALPCPTPESVRLDQKAVAACATLDDGTRQTLEDGLRKLHPWRKGPFAFHGIDIATEWRSDWKWDRVAPHVDLAEARVLDVGCGNGYFGWRMLAAGARAVVGIDPTLLFVFQHLAAQRLLQREGNWVLPLGIEDLPDDLSGFDTVFSMGVLYHRPDPVGHLRRLRNLARIGGTVVIETLVVEGDEQHGLVPEGRYARMRNVWFLPSTALLERWLARLGFADIRTVDVTRTTVDEQRSTDWMRFESLAQCLDADNPSQTIEGYPAPLRAVTVARRRR